MKVIIKISSIVFFICLSCCVYSQTEAIPYHTVLYDSDGTVLNNLRVSVEVGIIQGFAEGTVVYRENHEVISESNGNIYLEIGTGTAILNQLTNVDWEQPNFISISFQPEGFGMVYTNNIVELFSVPYALFSLKVTCIEGCPGPPGETFDCWDLNFNQIQDNATEDVNGDGIVDAIDCTGPPGPQGPQGPDGVPGAKGADGLNGVAQVEYLSVPIASPTEGDYYIDDGSNREDGNIGFRYFDGTNWIDL